jgi:hypothetical protein
MPIEGPRQLRPFEPVSADPGFQLQRVFKTVPVGIA